MFPQPRGDIMASEGSKSQKLMIQNQLLVGASSGSFSLLPHVTRALEKLHRVIDKELQVIGCQKIALPCIASGAMWKKSKRWEEMGSELFVLKDRNDQDYCLAPTHEEAVTSVVAAQSPISYKQLPIKLYQIGRKFRDEMRPKNGLLRCREFEMKDLYTFHQDDHCAEETYQQVCEAYAKIFQNLGLDHIKVSASSGAMGGSRSDEFHLQSDIGEDTLLYCARCGRGFNIELEDKIVCDRKECSKTFNHLTGIEVAHAFILGTRYSKTFNALYVDENHKKKALVMGCYGIGVTRLLAASIEVLSTDTEIQWPLLLAPYQAVIIPQKAGFKSDITSKLAEDLHVSLLSKSNLQDEVLLDDRIQLSIGKRVYQAKQMGYPYIITVGKKALEDVPLVELIDVRNQHTEFLTQDKVVEKMSLVQTVLI